MAVTNYEARLRKAADVLDGATPALGQAVQLFKQWTLLDEHILSVSDHLVVDGLRMD